MSPEVARRVVALFREIRPPERADYQLTPHETRLLKLLVEGHNYKTAAVELEGERQHHLVPHAPRLREAAGALEVRSRRQGPAQPDRPLKTFPSNSLREINPRPRHRSLKF